ncbi:hypothetical protein APHAL10511_006949 [Amanita phalloides]|nr:hypothetical protein APHAL10511_006949 [Amanita phalloides]
MDLVVNHTSDEHEWFLQSRSSKNNPKRDWYIWRTPKYDADGMCHEPNNWRSVFQGSAWDYDDRTGEYYLHLYVSKQPDLNWDNPDVRDAVWDLMRFWLDRGCDGFRLDVINLISKVEGLPDAPVTAPGEEYQLASTLFANGPRVHEYIQEMNTKVLSKYDVMTVGETPFTHDEDTLAEYGLPKNKELNMLFQFEIMDLDAPPEIPLKRKEWKLSKLKSIIHKWQNFKRDEGFWNTVFIENHDHARVVSRFGNDTTDEKRACSAKLLALLEICQGGTLYIYQGQELGLKNFPVSWGIEEYKDVASLNYWDKVKKQRQEEQGREDVDMSDVLGDFAHKARDHARVPMQWDSTLHAGFTTGKPWMRVNDDYQEWNAERQVNDKNSVHAFWKQALAFRKQHDVLIYGDFEEICAGDEQVFAFVRTLGETWILVLLNFKDEEVEISLDVSGYRLGLGSYGDGREEGLRLRCYEGRILSLTMSKRLRIYSSDDVRNHGSESSCWVTRAGKVYDVTSFLADHPGGEDYILQHAGQDVAKVMQDVELHDHSSSAFDMLEEYAIGRLGTDDTIVGDDWEATDDFHPDNTDSAKDYEKNQFLDLRQPLFMQIWRANFSKSYYLKQVHQPRHLPEPARLFGPDILEVCTRTVWYVVPLFWAPIAANLFLRSVFQFTGPIPAFTSNPRLPLNSLSVVPADSWAKATICFFVGNLIWTMLEYGLHRFLFHIDEWLPDKPVFLTLHFLMHGIHHYLPMDRLRLVMPPLLFGALQAPFTWLAHVIFPTAVANGIISGAFTFYIFYDCMHYALHHTSLPTYLKEMKKYHLAHHYKNFELGFGVTSKIWDYVFNTVLLV